MNTFPTIGLSEFKKTFSIYDNYIDKLILADLDMSVKEKEGIPSLRMAPTRLNQLTLLFALQGEVKLSVDHYPYQVKADNVLLISPSHLIQATDMSSDFRGKILVVDLDFMQELKPSDLNPSVSNFMEMRKHPVIQMTRDEMQHLIDYLALIKEKIHLRNHIFQSYVVKGTALLFFFELINIVAGKRDNLTAPPQPTRREEITNNFLTLLIENCKEEHEVSFYADKLFITPQYLSLALKDVTGKTANLLIDQAIMTEAKILLRSQEYTAQQIADILHFADHSTFGKFFKKNAGVTPIEYRKRVGG